MTEQKQHTQHTNKRGVETVRLEALSDGVLAVAITLLVISFSKATPEITENPKLTGSAILTILCNMWPHYLSYCLTFLMISVYFMLHHTIFNHVHRADRNLFWINKVFLMSVVFLPFPTDLLAGCLFHETNIIIVFYGVSHAVCGYLLLGIWQYSMRTGLVDDEVQPETCRAISKSARLGPALNLLGAGMSFAWIPAGMAIFALVPLAYIFPRPAEKVEELLPTLLRGERPRTNTAS